jgi:hypothetical protein
MTVALQQTPPDLISTSSVKSSGPDFTNGQLVLVAAVARMGILFNQLISTGSYLGTDLAALTAAISKANSAQEQTFYDTYIRGETDPVKLQKRQAELSQMIAKDQIALKTLDQPTAAVQSLLQVLANSLQLFFTQAGVAIDAQKFLANLITRG